ncbi:MAG: DUF5615 family PIN-like protein [Sphingomonadaceae bacterium]
MKFLVDAQLPPFLCDWLAARGHKAHHVFDRGLRSAQDADIAALAEADQCCRITKDDDFLRLRLPDRFSLIWMRCGNATNPALEVWLAQRWPEVERLLNAGERMIELK